MADVFVGRYTQGSREVLDYQIDWSTVLAAESDTGASSAWYSEAGTPTIGDGANGASAPSLSLGIATAWLVGGNPGEIYHLTNVLTTDGGRKFEASIQVKVIDK